MLLEVNNLSVSYPEFTLHPVSFALDAGEMLTIVGESGSGKTTMLRCLNFLERPDSGIIRVNGETLFDAADSSAKQEEEIRKKRLHFGLVFQSFNLFPQYTALDNVILAKELLAKEQPDYKARKKEIHDEIEALAEQLLKEMGLGERMKNYPHQLSGGMCQRASLARALVGQPKVLLLDEPLGALDAFTRMNMQDEILRIWKETGMTAIMVTHDVDEAVYLSDKVVVMTPRPGRITGTLDIKLARPRARSSEDFLHYRAEILRQLHYGGTIKEPNYYI